MGYNNTKILVIDDDPWLRDFYNLILSSRPLSGLEPKDGDHSAKKPLHAGANSGRRQFEITLADGGVSGVMAVKTAIDNRNPFAAAFVDMMMPGMDGAETARQIWSIDPDIKLVIVTAHSDYTPDDIIRLVGREDLFYLRKPFNPEEIRQFARALTNQWNLEREKEMLSEKLAQAHEREINTAARIQQTLLLGLPPQDIPGLQLHQRAIPSQKVDGDFIDFIRLGDMTLDVVVGDVMGKGIPAALVGAALKSQLLRALNELIREDCAAEIPEPETIVSAVQAGMIQQLEDLETFVTLCYVRFDLSRNMIRFVDCGHTRTIHYQEKTQTCRLLEGVNMPLGFPETEAFASIKIPFTPGDLFVFYSDGLTEAKNAHGELYGERRLVEFVQRHAGADPDQLIQDIWQDVVSFSASEFFADDFSCIAVRISDMSGTGALHLDEGNLEIKSDLNELGRVREFVRSFCGKLSPNRLTPSRVDMIELAVNEAVANIIKHACPDVSGDPIRLQALLSVDRLVFRLYDRGRCFDPSLVPSPSFDGSRDHGFGIYIMGKVVDELEYTRDENGTNCAAMTINLKGVKGNAVRYRKDGERGCRKGDDGRP